MISDALPDPIRVLVVSSTGMLRSEILAACDDDDITAVGVADARAAETASRETEPHALVAVADDSFNCRVEDLVHRVKLASRGKYRIATLLLAAHGGPLDMLSAYHAGADDIGRWPLEADMLRARIRSIVRVATLESSMGNAAVAGTATPADLQEALSQSIHLINNAVAGISGRAQLAALTQTSDESGLVPVCLSEARKMGVILAALHGLSESIGMRREREERELAGAVEA